MPTSFVRDRFTWLAYLMLAYFAYVQAILGPLVPFLRDELDLNYTVGGLHVSAFSLGMVLAGLWTDRLAQRWGRQRVFWGGGAGMAVGVILLVLGHHAAMTILGAFVMGLPGAFLLIMVQSTLSDRHGEQRAIALTESNVIAVFAAGLGPVFVGGLQRIGVGWRGAPLVGVLVWGVLLLTFRREPIPVQKRETDTSRRPPLPTLFWLYWVIAFLSVSVESCVVFWGAEFLRNSVGFSRVNASSLMSVFFLAMVIGRFTGSRLTRSRPVSTLLLGAVCLTVAGFLPFWLAPAPALNVAGLFTAGLGIANLFPFTLSVASSVVKPSQADRASGRVALAAGTAILIIPQAVGVLADQVGIKGAYTVTAVFLLLALAAILVARRRVTGDRQGRQDPGYLPERP